MRRRCGGGETIRFCGHPTSRRVCGGSRLTKPDASSEPGSDPDRNGTGVGGTQRCCNPLGQRRWYGLPVRSGQLPGGQGHHVGVEPDWPGLVVFGGGFGRREPRERCRCDGDHRNCSELISENPHPGEGRGVRGGRGGWVLGWRSSCLSWLGREQQTRRILKSHHLVQILR